MTKRELYQLLESGPVILDGATGTNLQQAGMPLGVCPEDWIRHHKEEMIKLQKEYVEAGSQILYAPTFTASRIKLAEYGLEDELEDINRAMVRISREAADGRAYVAGDLSMTGHQLYPTGDMMFEELVDIYKEQVAAILKEGVDLFVVETMMSLQECRAALLAIKESCQLPVMISLTFQEDGRTLFGSRPDTSMIVLQSMGADVVGLNCSTGPEAMIPYIEQMKEYATIPIMAKPNAGLPELEDGKTIYRMTPEEFAQRCKNLFEAGASIVGGCCGTTPQHIRALNNLLGHDKVDVTPSQKLRVITSERRNVEIEEDGPFLVIGERINPTGKKALQEDLRSGSLELVCEYARQQEEKGADVLDINMGINGIDEKQMMIDAIYEVTHTTDLPLCIDTSSVEVMEAALRIYPGRALINSISGEDDRMEKILPLAKKYGAMFILLPVSSAGLPKTVEEKHDNIRHVLQEANRHGISQENAIIDLVVATVGADLMAAENCFATLDYCKKAKLPTVCGLSNISFGLPQRLFVNTSFLNIAISKGLSMAILNPSQDLLMYTAMASDMLMKKEDATDKYLNNMPENTLSMSGGKAVSTIDEVTSVSRIYDCVVKGEKKAILQEVRKKLEEGVNPQTIIEEELIPGINEVGRRYDQKKYFLPQLIAGANAMKIAMEEIEPLLTIDSLGKRETIVIATVEGDIHDIGKNLVVLMLKNHGYQVIDLGKDISAQEIVAAAVEHHAQVIGLSALMTTTMMNMKEVIALVHKQNLDVKVFIGGACITPSFAEEIGADAYSSDAQDAVKVVSELLK